MSKDELELDLGTVTMSCTTDEVAKTLAALLAEMRSVIPKLRPDERVVLRQIMARDSGALTVGDVFPDFARESEAHKTLRRFRAAQFIRPAKTGRWDPDEQIEIKPFARLTWDRVGEEAIFSDLPAAVPAPQEAPEISPDEDALVVEEPVAEERIVVEEPANEEEAAVVEMAADEEEVVVPKKRVASEDPAEVEKRAAAIWEDDDVLDLQDFADEEVRGKR